MKELPIPSPIGFKAGGIHCGIKKRKKDLALIYSEVPAVCAGMFTTNKAQAEPVKLTRNVVSNGILQAIIINSGCANALTGRQGEHDAYEMARVTASALMIDISKVAVASTGPIGRYLPIRIVLEGIEKLAKKIDSNSFKDASEAILTTDTYPKFISRQIEIGGKKATITAIAKGAGMIYPHLSATMLCFITTDLMITQPILLDILKYSVEQSFNCISVDGCTSTNDMVIAMANGMAENPIIDRYGQEFELVLNEFKYITKELAKMIVSDGEGGTKLIEIEINGTVTFEDARTVGFAISNYNLLKCSFFGESINVGRIMAAIGSSSIPLDIRQVNIYMGKIPLVKNGELCQFPETEVFPILKQKKINIKIELNQGQEKATVWTTDLSPRYIKINME